MSETTQACVRGCALLRQHLTDCDDEGCRGCLPRRAQHGNFCWPCHRRFELMLTDAPVVFRWLTGNMGAGDGAARAKQDFESRGGAEGSPAPLKVAIYDARQLLADQLTAWADDLAENRTLRGPQRHSVDTDARFLLTWLTTVETLDWVGDWFEELAETMSAAHALAPWRPEVKRCSGVPCPECGEVNLVIFGGESDVTCMSCRNMIRAQHFGLWEQILRDEKAAAS